MKHRSQSARYPRAIARFPGSLRQPRPVYRRLPGMELQQLQFLEQQMAQLEREIAQSAQQIIAEVGPAAAVFPSEKNLASWIGVCPGEEISADEPHSTQSPKGNRSMRRLLTQAAHAAVKMKGSIFEVTSRRLIARMPYKEAIWAIAHRLCRLIWKILHQGIRYEERGPAVSAQAKRRRLAKMTRELTKAGYRVHVPTPNPA